MAQAVFTPAPEVREIAEDLIKKYHQHLIDFSVKIEYIFVDKTPKSKGMEIWGSCRKVSNLNAFLANEQEGTDPFFVITISYPVWEILTIEQRLALIDHELCHASAEASQKEDEDGSEEVVKLSVQPHDLEEFTCIVRRHGLWRDGISEIIKAAEENKNQES